MNAVKTKVILNLTKRQLICFAVAGVVGIPLFFLLKAKLNASAATICMIIVMLPAFLMAMYEKHGQPLEKVLWHILQVSFLRPKQRPYQTNNFYACLERQQTLDKEVFQIVHPEKAHAGRKKADRGGHRKSKETG